MNKENLYIPGIINAPMLTLTRRLRIVIENNDLPIKLTKLACSDPKLMHS